MASNSGSTGQTPTCDHPFLASASVTRRGTNEDSVGVFGFPANHNHDCFHFFLKIPFRTTLGRQPQNGGTVAFSP